MTGVVDTRKQDGLSLIEVMVAAVIIAIGLLGLAELQMRSLQMNQSAHYLSQANYHAYDIIDAMRLDPERARKGDYNLSMGDDAPGGGDMPDATLRRWVDAVESTLPVEDSDDTGGSVDVTKNGDSHEVRVEVAWVDERWRENDAGDEDSGVDEDSRIQSVIVETGL